MEDFKQDFLFPDLEKGKFSWKKFESDTLTDHLTVVFRNAFRQVNNKLDNHDFSDYKKRTIAGAINDIVTKCIDEECRSNMIGTIRNLYERDVLPVGNHLFIFKKHPVSNIETSFSTKMASQEVPVHVITVVYNVNEFYNISSVNIQYRENDNIVYNKRLLLEQNMSIIVKDNQTPNIIKVVPKLKVTKKEAAK